MTLPPQDIALIEQQLYEALDLLARLRAQWMHSWAEKEVMALLDKHDIDREANDRVRASRPLYGDVREDKGT